MENNNKSSDNRIIKHLFAFSRKVKSGLRRVKSVLIIALAVLAIYQTSQLWFVNLANRNFFLFLSARFTPSVPDGYREFVRPMRYIYGAGDGRFTIEYTGLMEIPPRIYFDNVLSELFDSGTFAGESETDFNRLLSRPVLIYEYAFPMPGDVFPLGFNQRTGAFLTTRGITEFTSVVIWPPYAGNTRLSVFFINGDRTWEFGMDSATGAGFKFTIHPASTMGLHFVSAALEGYEHLPHDTFIARTGQLGNFPADLIVVTNPYLTHIGPSMHFIRNQVVHFFDNPATINSRVGGDGIWTFNNIHTTVRYFYTHVLEYNSFRPRRQNVTTSLMDDFSAALAFIEEDRHVINEIFLTGFEPRGAGYVFWFGYIVNNFPILMPYGWAVSSPTDILPAPIEVVVEQGRVVFYRRLAHNFHSDGHVWLDFNLDAFLERQPDGVINDLALGYLMRPHGNLRLDWWASISEHEEPEGYDAADGEESDA